VFIVAERRLVPGTLLGLVPGVIYANAEAKVKGKKSTFKKTELPYLVRGRQLLDFEDPLFYPDYAYHKSIEKLLRDNQTKPVEVQGSWINPYAVGQFINHPPPGHGANVTFVDISVPASFYPTSLMRYFPYQFYADTPQGLIKKERTYQALGVIALEPLEGRTELFVNYSSDRFAGEFEPDWLVDPPEGTLDGLLVKKEAYHDFSVLNKWVLRLQGVTGTVIDSVTQSQRPELAKALQETKLFAQYYDQHHKQQP
jgi:hypothetical protein